MARREVIATAQAPPAVGPYSQAIRFGDLLYCSGQLGLDPTTGRLVAGPPEVQLTRALQNLEAICRAAGTALGRSVRLTIYTTALERFSALNEAYASFFEELPPARVTVGVAALPLGAAVEVEAVVSL